MKVSLPSLGAAKRFAALLAILFVAAIALLSAGWLINRIIPHRDPVVPIEVARKDEKAAAAAATQAGAPAVAANRDADIHLQVTTKDIRDVFDSERRPDPANARRKDGGDPATGQLPAAPVERLRDRLNESVARANRAADAAADSE